METTAETSPSLMWNELPSSQNSQNSRVSQDSTSSAERWTDGVSQYLRNNKEELDYFLMNFQYCARDFPAYRSRLRAVTPISLCNFLSNSGAAHIDSKFHDATSCKEMLDGMDDEEFDVLAIQLAEIFGCTEYKPRSLREKLDAFSSLPVFRTALQRRTPSVEDLTDQHRQLQKKATMAAWETPFIGDIQKELWEHIQQIAQRTEGKYANLCGIIQSSGTGKSRMVDELGKEHFVINICLRDGGSSGYPPADIVVRDYLTQSMKWKKTGESGQYHDVNFAERRLDAFLDALFTVTLGEVRKLDNELGSRDKKYSSLSKKFRRCMTEGQSFESPNDYRLGFYENVIRRAETIVNNPSPANACRDLCDALNALHEEESGETANPVVIIAIDESATLSQYRDKEERVPPPLNTFLRRLSLLATLPFFSLFLSTTGQIATFLASRGLPDRSARLVTGTLQLDPAFTGCVFDGFAPEAEEGKISVMDVAKESYMMLLGRPLWATRLNSANSDVASKLDVKRTAMEFAVGKLLNWRQIPAFSRWSVNEMAQVACLAVRLPIEFYSTCYTFQTPLVENHMRICLRLDPVTEDMVTMSASEPVLAEAAFIAMKNPKCDFLEAFARVLSGFAIHKGDRGEVIVLLLLLLARDHAVSAQNDRAMWEDVGRLPTMRNVHRQEDVQEWNRVISVPDFIRHLFVDLDKKIIRDIEKSLGDTHMHFNHFIRGYQHGLLKIPFLMALLVRGAGLLCANSQKGVDAALAYIKGPIIKREATGLILVQARNNIKYTDKPQWSVNEAMNPIDLGINPDTNDLPVIRIVFALASSTSSLHARKVRFRSKSKSFVAYDIWCAGLNNAYIGPIDDGSALRWNTLLNATQPWKYNYTPPTSDLPKEFLQMMTPGMGLEKPFWKYFPGVRADAEEEQKSEEPKPSRWRQMNALNLDDDEMDTDTEFEEVPAGKAGASNKRKPKPKKKSKKA